MIFVIANVNAVALLESPTSLLVLAAFVVTQSFLAAEQGKPHQKRLEQPKKHRPFNKPYSEQVKLDPHPYSRHELLAVVKEKHQHENQNLSAAPKPETT